MKSSWFFLVVTLPLLGVGAVGCQGDAANGDQGGSGGTDEPLPPPSERSLNRNPEHPLVCDKSGAINPKVGQLARLTNEEVTNSIRDLMFANGGEPANELADGNTAGFTNNVANQFSAPKLLVESLDRMFLNAAAKAAAKPEVLAGCSPKNESEEMTCGKKFITDFGKRVWRRPLKDAEKQRLEGLFTQSRKDFGFGGALEVTVAALLHSPQFTYRFEFGTGDATNDKKDLSPYEMASRLSYFLTNSLPDADLFAAAEKNELRSAADVEKQVKRLLADPKARVIGREFHTEYFDLQRWNREALSKEASVFPKYSAATAQSLESGLNTYVDEMFWRDGATLGEFLSAPVAWVDKNSASTYGVEAPGGDGLQQVSLDEAKWGGFLTQAGLMAGMAHTTEQASIIRGNAVLEKVLCAPTPPPPPNAPLVIPPAPTGEKLTYRQRVERTVEVGSCRSCHVKIDGVGFLFENYDGVGAYQEQENGLPVNASGKLEGTLDADGSYKNIVEALKPLAKSEQVAQCVAEHWYQYALARSLFEGDGCEIASVTDAFVESKGNFQALLVAIAKSQAFRTTTTLPLND